MSSRLLHDARGDQRFDGVGGRRRANCVRRRNRLGCFGLRRHGPEHCAGLGRLGRRNYLSRLLGRRDLSTSEQSGLGGQKALAQQRPAGFGDRVEQRLRPAVLNEHQRQPLARQQGFGQGQRIGGTEAR